MGCVFSKNAETLPLRMWPYLEIESLQMVREDEVIRVGPNAMWLVSL